MPALASVDSILEHFFKPDVRKAGADLVAKRAVFLKIGSDTQINSSVRGSTPCRVSFRAVSIESEVFEASCTCKASQRGQLCKHIWATLLVAEAETPDFFVNKNSLEKMGSEKSGLATEPQRSGRVGVQAASPTSVDFKAKLKDRQSAYRREMYQQQKRRKKQNDENRTANSGSSKFTQALPPQVVEALKYFEANGFSLNAPASEAEINSAKRILSRVFHPDRGGTQDEIVELFKYADVLIAFR